MCLFTFDTSINFWSKYPKIKVIDIAYCNKSNKKTKRKNDKDQLILGQKYVLLNNYSGKKTRR